MRIAVLGAGGVGGYFGARLAAGDTDVTFVARGAHLAAIQRDGLRVTSQRGDVHLRDVKAVDDIAKAGEVDLVIVGVKLWDTEMAAARGDPLVAERRSQRRGAAQVRATRSGYRRTLLYHSRDRRAGNYPTRRNNATHRFRRI
ncbi:2-dehydropantoate 2-reductase [Phyllobacterium sp. LjRoot231]